MFKTEGEQIEFYYQEGLEDHQAQLHLPGNLYFTMLRRQINSHLWRHVRSHGRDGLLADIGCAEGLYLRHWAADFERRSMDQFDMQQVRTGIAIQLSGNS